MRKAILKRIKFTKTGKMLHRKAGHNHFNAKSPRKSQLHQNKMTSLPKAIGKRMRAYLNSKS